MTQPTPHAPGSPEARAREAYVLGIIAASLLGTSRGFANEDSEVDAENRTLLVTFDDKTYEVRVRQAWYALSRDEVAEYARRTDQTEEDT